MSLVQLITPYTICQTRSAHVILFGWLCELIDEQEAINASSWAGNASIGEEYIGEGFKLRIIG